MRLELDLRSHGDKAGIELLILSFASETLEMSIKAAAASGEKWFLGLSGYLYKRDESDRVRDVDWIIGRRSYWAEKWF